MRSVRSRQIRPTEVRAGQPVTCRLVLEFDGGPSRHLIHRAGPLENVGCVILPPGFQSNPRNIKQNYQDTMVIV